MRHTGAGRGRHHFARRHRSHPGRGVRRHLAGVAGRERGRDRRAGGPGPGLSQGGQQHAYHLVGVVRRHHRLRADHRRGDPGAVAGPPDGPAPSRPLRAMAAPARGAARRGSGPGHPAARPRPTGRGTREDRSRLRRPAADWSGQAVDRVWLRGTVAIGRHDGRALIAVATATYLMAVGHDGPSWVAYGRRRRRHRGDAGDRVAARSAAAPRRRRAVGARHDALAYLRTNSPSPNVLVC